MRKKIILAVVAVIAVLAVFGGIKFLQIRSMISAAETMPIPVETVTSTEVKEVLWQPVLKAIGSISAVHGLTVSAELPGVVKEIAFESGAQVEKGALLVQLDVGAEQSQLRSAEADVALTAQELERARDLRERKVIANAEWDAAEARAKQAVAQVDNVRSAIEKKTIRAPFAGRLGIRQVNLGQVLNAGQPIVSLQSLDPIYVDFSLPQQQLSELKVGMKVRVTTDAFPGRQFNGELSAINSSLDAVTRSIPLQATLPNTDGLLRPGMFANVEVILPQDNPVLIIPATAVSYAPYGDSVFVIEKTHDEKSGEDSLTLRLQNVRIGEARGDFVAVTKGLKKGERIVSSGVFKLRNGSPVTIDNALAPKPEIAPKPAET